MKTFAIVNQKGGCGKTTTSINLAACLADQGHKVLLLDMDPQSHASLGLNIQAGELDLGLYDVLLAVGESDGPRLDDIIIPVTKNLDLIPSSIILSAFEQKMAGVAGRETRLLEAVNTMEGAYDYLLIDCPPSVGLLSFNALMAVHHVIIPIEPSFFSLHGLGKQIESIRIFTEKLNHVIEIHTLVTMFDRRTRLSREVWEEVQKHFEKELFQTVIHNNIRLKEAAGYGSPISEFDRHSIGFHDFQALAEEVAQLKTIEVREQPMATLGPRLVRNGILFSLDAPNVETLKLVGDFNNWTPDKNSELEKSETGKWEKVLSLPPGRYHYKFIADGEWREDSGNPNYIVNDFGGIDSVVEVKPVEFPELMQQDRSLGLDADQQEAI